MFHCDTHTHTTIAQYSNHLQRIETQEGLFMHAITFSAAVKKRY